MQFTEVFMKVNIVSIYYSLTDEIQTGTCDLSFKAKLVLTVYRWFIYISLHTGIGVVLNGVMVM